MLYRVLSNISTARTHYYFHSRCHTTHKAQEGHIVDLRLLSRFHDFVFLGILPCGSVVGTLYKFLWRIIDDFYNAYHKNR